MPTLELVMDATGMQRGQQQAEASLKGVQVAAEKTQASVTAVGSGLRNTFQAVQGVSQVGQGINATAQALGSMSLSMGAFAASRTLLEIGKTAQDFKEMAGTVTVVTRDIYGMTSATTRAATAFEVIGAVVRAHPLLTIATVIGAAAGLMSLFASNTKVAASAFDDLAASMDKTRLSQRTAEYLGVSRGGANEEMRNLFNVAQYLEQEGPGNVITPKTYTLDQIQRMLGAPTRAGLAADLGVREPSLSEFGGSLIAQQRAFRETQVPYDQLRSYVRDRYREFEGRSFAQASIGVSWPPTGIIPHQPMIPQDPFGISGLGRDYVSVSESQQREIDRDNAQAAADRIAESMERAARSAESIGGAFGAAAFDVLAGVQGLRQALLSIVQQFGRQGLSSLGADLFGATTRQLQGRTNPGPEIYGPPAP